MKVAEIYSSLQGEGEFTGTPSAFIRVSGCNLRCQFCDSPFTSWQPSGVWMSVEQIVTAVRSLHKRHVVVTGGEPLLFADVVPLTEQLAAEGFAITIETAGTVWQAVACDLMSISPKLSNSAPSRATDPDWFDRHEMRREAAGVLRRLVQEYHYQIKFVIGTPEDVLEMEQFLVRYPSMDRNCVYLMPEGTAQMQLREIGEWLEPLCAANGFHFCPRKHIEWFGHVRGT